MTVPVQPTAADEDSSYDDADKIPLSKLVDMNDDTKKKNDNSSSGREEESKMEGDLKPNEPTNDNTAGNGTDANQIEIVHDDATEVDVPGKDMAEKSSHYTSDPPIPRSAAAVAETPKEPASNPNSNKDSSKPRPEVQFLEQRNVNDPSETNGASNIDRLATTQEPPQATEPEPMDVDQASNVGAGTKNKDATTKEETIPENQPAGEMAVETSVESLLGGVDTPDSNLLQDANSEFKPENSPKVDQSTVTENGARRERPKSDHSPGITPINPVEVPALLESMQQDSTDMEVDPHEATETQEATVTEVLDFVLPPTVPAKIVSSCEDDETGDVFAAFKKVSHAKKSSKKRPLPVKVSIAVSWDTKEDEKKEDDASNYSLNPPSTFRCDVLNVSVEEQIAQAEAELEDSLSFFRDSHEDQDPAFAAFMKSQKRKQIEAELKALELEDEAGRKEIDAVVGSQIKSKQASTDDQFERYKAKKAAEEKQAMAKLQTMFNDKVVSNQSKINQGIEVLKKRHSTEAQRYLAQHRQQVAQRNLPEHIASQEWANLQQQLNNKHKSQVQEFMGKGEDVKKRTEAEYRREMAKIRSQYEKQVQDVENNRRVIYQKIFAGYQQIRQRYVKRHIQKIMKKREVLENALGEKDTASTLDVVTKLHSKDDSRSSQEEHLALQPPSPIKSSGHGLDTFPYEKSGAAARHKHRKGVLSQISKQLSVEIHNEGVWMAVLQEKKEEKKKEEPSDPHTESEQKLFLPWGIKARDFLESIICGEIPSELELSDFDFGDSVAMNGGHLRCVLTDLRTSDETARMQRVQAVGEQPNIETAALEQKAIELQAAYNNADKVHAKFEKDEKDTIPQVKEAIQDYEAKKLHWDNFRSKFGKFLGPDGNPVPQTNPSDRQKLTQAIAKYRGNVENAEKQAKAAQLKLRKVKEEVQKYSNLKKQTQRAAAIAAAAVKKQKSIVSSGQSFSRVKDAISALELTADKRREQLNLKRTNSTSSTWVQNLPGVPGPLRRSLWHKMHRRRQQIVLRPSQDTVTADLKAAVLDRLSKVVGVSSMPEASKPLELQKAEQAYLVAAHPLAPPGDIIASVPSSSSPWGEPGWHLVLDVPKPICGQILPRAIGAPIVEKNLSEINSAPGRQASSMLRSTQIRSLATPLSAISTVTSLAETNPGVAMSTQTRHVENDPMNPTERQLEEGYAFNAKLIVPTKPAVPARRKSLNSTDSPGTSSNVKGGTNMAIPASTPKQATGEHSSAGSPSKTPRKRKPTADAAIKPLQRRKPAPSKPTAAQAKALQVQQQKQRQALAAAAAAQRQQQKVQQQTQQLQQHQHLQPQTQHLQPQTQHLPAQTQHLQPPTQHLQPQNQHLTPQNQHLPPQNQPKPQQQQTMGHSHYQRQQSINVMDRSQNSYGQFMQPLATPPNQAPPQNYQQQLYHQQQQQSVQQRQVPQQQQFQPQQLAQLRMMQQQQQQQQQAPSQQVQYGSAPHGIQPMPQFFQPMQQQFAHAPIGMPGQVVGQPGMPMNLQGNNNVRQNPPNGDDSNDPLFMLK